MADLDKMELSEAELKKIKEDSDKEYESLLEDIKKPSILPKVMLAATLILIVLILKTLASTQDLMVEQQDNTEKITVVIEDDGKLTSTQNLNTED